MNWHILFSISFHKKTWHLTDQNQTRKFKPNKLNRESGEIIPNGRPRLKIAMTSIENPIEIGLERVGNRYEAKFYCSRVSNEFFGFKLFNTL